MIITRLAGGLGNQLFQLGASLLIARKERIIIDDSSLHNYNVKRENIIESLFDLTAFSGDINFKNAPITKLRIPKLFPIKFNKYPFISDKNFNCALKMRNKKITILDGYFQDVLNQEQFEIITKTLQRGFIVNPDSHMHNETCIVHIRGGDFIKLGWNATSSSSYYENSIEFMKKKGFRKFNVVSDDSEYAKYLLKNISYTNLEFISKNSKHDFLAIASCKNRILSSSTFSFWASAIGNNKNSCVIAPSFWTPTRKRYILLPNEIKHKWSTL